MMRDEQVRATTLFERIPLFAGCTHKELERLVAASQPVAFHPGEKLCVAGGDAPEAYVVAEGNAAVTVGNVTVAQVGPADVVGERGPITGKPRAATVTATTHLTAYAISRQELQELMMTSPTAAETMRDELLRRYG